MSYQVIVNFNVVGNWLHEAFGRIEVDIMSHSLAVQNASGLFQAPDYFGTFHKTISLIRYWGGTSSMTISG
jgi:hypothetical protein